MRGSGVFTTHIGSLPHLSQKDAFSFNSKFDLPCLFSLPKLDKNQFMLPDSARVLGIDLDARVFMKEYKLGKEVSPYLEELVVNLNSTHLGFKYQLLGPYSAYHFYGFEEQNYPFVRFLEEISRRYEEIIKSLYNYGLHLFFFDEPVLSQLQKDSNQLEQYLEWYKSIDQNLDIELGIHCCEHLNLDLRPFQALPLHLDWSLFNEIDLDKLHELKFFGLSNGSIPLTLNIGNLKNLRKKSIFLAPSCGLALKNSQEILDTYSNLEESKRFILESNTALI